MASTPIKPLFADEDLQYKFEVTTLHKQDLEKVAAERRKFEREKAERLAKELAAEAPKTEKKVVLDEQYYPKLYAMIDDEWGNGRGLGRHITLDKDDFSIFFGHKCNKRIAHPIIHRLSNAEVDAIIKFIEEDASLPEPRIRSIELSDSHVEPLTGERLEKLFSVMATNKQLERLELEFTQPTSGFVEHIAAIIKDQLLLKVLMVKFNHHLDIASLKLLNAATTCPNLEYIDVNFRSVKEEMLEPAVKMLDQHILNFSRLNTVCLTLPGLWIDPKTMEAIFKPLHSKSINLILNSPNQRKECLEVIAKYLNSKQSNCLLKAVDLDNAFGANILDSLPHNTSLKQFSAKTLGLDISYVSYVATLEYMNNLLQVAIVDSKYAINMNKFMNNQENWLYYLKHLCPTLMAATGNKLSAPLTAMIADYVDEYRYELANSANPLFYSSMLMECYALMQTEFRVSDFRKPGVGFGTLWRNSMDKKIPLKPNQIDVTNNQWKRLAAPQIPLPPKKKEACVLSDLDIVANDVLELPSLEVKKKAEKAKEFETTPSKTKTHEVKKNDEMANISKTMVTTPIKTMAPSTPSKKPTVPVGKPAVLATPAKKPEPVMPVLPELPVVEVSAGVIIPAKKPDPSLLTTETIPERMLRLRAFYGTSPVGLATIYAQSVSLVLGPHLANSSLHQHLNATPAVKSQLEASIKAKAGSKRFPKK